MIKKIIAGFCLLFAAVGFSQENNASPYSYYGLGDQKFKGTVDNRSMGGVSMVPDSIHINLQNPATYASLKYTTFTLGAGNSSTNLETNTQSDKTNRTSLDYLAVAIPFNNFGFVVGIMPYTSVGYKIEDYETGSDGLSRYKKFDGSGGLNRVFAGVGYKITPKLSVGGEFAYNFGNIETSSLIAISEVQYATKEFNKSHYDGASFNFGATYVTKVNNKYIWSSSAVFSTQANLKSTTERELSTVTLNAAGTETTVDLVDVRAYDESVKLPSKFTVGSGFGRDRKWFAGAEYTFQESNEMGNRFDNVTDAAFQSAYKVSLGGYYIPNYSSLTSYFNRITYRAGLKYANTGLVINQQEIKDYGFSFGLGLPLGGYNAASNVNIGMELGKRGTKNAGLVQENYVNVFVSLSFNDRWFVKRKYD